MPKSSTVTPQELLARASRGDKCAASQFFDHIYPELHRLAKAKFARERKGHTLQPTALVSQVWLKLCASNFPDVASCNEFRRIAAAAMKQILIDHARRCTGQKRARPKDRVCLDDHRDESVDFQLEIDIADALEPLKNEHERAAELVQLRYFGGWSINEAAETLGISRETAKNDWRFAKAWLHKRLSND